MSMATDESLFRWEDEFADDFDFADIQQEAVAYILLTELECSTILSYATRREQVKKLFSILVDGEKNLAIFTGVLTEKYGWLAEKLQRQVAGDEIYSYRKQIEMLRSELPKHMDLNVKRTKQLYELEQKLLDLQVREHLVVHGYLGYGKRYLVYDACSNFAVMKRMDFNIFWLNVSKCKTPEMVLTKLQKLQIMLTNQSTSTRLSFDNFDDTVSKKFKLKQYLREIISENYKNCLLVLLDMPNLMTLRSFDLQCKILMTTRNKELLDQLSTKTTKTVQLSQGFEASESLGLFAKVLGIYSEDLPSEAVDIHRLCKGNPFLISLIAGNIKEYSNRTNRWIKWKNILEDIRPTDTGYHKLIEQSLTELSTEDYQRFRSLVVFTNDVNVPASLLQLYWGKGEREVEEIIKKFDKLYFVEKSLIKNDMLACSLQYHYYSYLKNEVTAAEKKKMHFELVMCYKILNAINTRTEPNIAVLADDGYFHYYIGYHLKEAERFDVFSKIFLDFGFLEQKLRATDLPNTIGDLKLYRKLITGNEPKKEKFLDELLQFLKSSEEMICKSEDTCLLQYAITTHGIVQEEAIRQAKRFSDRVWFHDNDHLSKHRQIVKVPKKPYLMKFFGPDAALAALDDHTIHLTDLSLSYTVEPTQYHGHKTKIIDIQIFLSDFFISLDKTGVCKVWSLKNTPNERRRSNGNSARVGARQNRTENGTLTNVNAGICCQTFDQKDKIVCIYLTHRDLVNEVGLFIACKSGRVVMYDWNSATYFSRTLVDFDTKMTQIKTMICTHPYFIVSNQKGNISFYDLKYSSQIAITAKLESYAHPLNIYDIGVCDSANNYIVVVFYDRIIQIKCTKYRNKVHTEVTELYSTTEELNKILCCAISEDLKYLILGTTKGIIVFDPIRKTEELRSSVSDNITCLDICSLDSDIYKYILISGSTSEAPTINISGLNFESEVMQWASDRMGSPINESNLCSHQRLNTWLQGGKLFQINNMDDIKEIELIAIDSRGDIHKRTSIDSFLKSEDVDQTMLPESQITVMSSIDKKYYFGYTNGLVFEWNNPQPFLILSGRSPVEYLKCFTTNLIVAATKTMLKVRNGQNELEVLITSSIVNTFMSNGYLIFVKDNCSFQIYDIDNNVIVNTYDACTEIYGGCDFALDCLIIGTKTPIFYVWHIKFDPVQATKRKELRLSTKSAITCIKLTKSREYFAIGCENGSIELYSFLYLKWLNTLQSNNAPINDMVFSPWSNSSMDSNSTMPIILTTVSDQICFWNISYVVNNPIDNGKLRRSQRFDRKASLRSITEKLKELTPINGNGNGNINGNVITGLNNILTPWMGKFGPTEKPELLSCIQLVGNAAEQIFVNSNFTEFLTIDDEGEVYYLKFFSDIYNDRNGNI